MNTSRDSLAGAKGFILLAPSPSPSRQVDLVELLGTLPCCVSKRMSRVGMQFCLLDSALKNLEQVPYNGQIAENAFAECLLHPANP